MTKVEFFKHCKSAAKGHPREVSQLKVVIRGRYRSMDHYAVFLQGNWCDGSIVDRELYCPLPGRQHQDWEFCRRRSEEERKKYQRWLEEYIAENPEEFPGRE